jgi:indole-3-glycerol phosphate synthase/phosphoribosylanthranilate isomerase
LRWVGVFVDAAPSDIATAARALDLHAVQLHGDESADDIAALRALLPDVAIWKAQRVGPRRSLDALGADRLLLDAYRHDAQGGTGRRFDWDVARAHPLLSELVLSGGITPDNAVDAMALGCWALDLSSGVERAPGEKDAGRIDALLSALRGKGKATA